MDKHTVNAFGCCCTRNIFNFSPMKDYFLVKKYAFQTAIWACFEPSLNIPREKLEEIDEAPFTRRMIHYDLNKVALQDFDDNPSDYFMIDLMSLSFPVYSVSYRGISTYMQNYFAASFLPKMLQMEQFQGISFNKMSILDVPENIVYRGLDRFCDWLLERYPVNRIVVYLPRRGETFSTAEGIVRSIPDKEIKANRMLDQIPIRFTEYILSRLSGCFYYRYEGELMAYDANYGTKQPPVLHYSSHNYIEQGGELVRMLLPEQCNGMLGPNSLLDIEFIKAKNQLNKINDQLNKGAVFSLNSYFRLFNKLYGYSNHAFLFVAREDASVFWKKFEVAEELGLKKGPALKNSYIGIYQPNLETFEEVGEKRITKTYQLDGHVFSLVSGGALCLMSGEQPVASCRMDGRELMVNRRGLNVVVYSLKEHKVVDCFVCDLNRDEQMLLQSSYSVNPFGI